MCFGLTTSEVARLWENLHRPNRGEFGDEEVANHLGSSQGEIHWLFKSDD